MTIGTVGMVVNEVVVAEVDVGPSSNVDVGMGSGTSSVSGSKSKGSVTTMGDAVDWT